MIWILFFTCWELLAQARPWVQTGFKSAALVRTTFFVKRNSDMDTREGKRYSKKRGRGKKRKKGHVTTNCQQRVWAKMSSESVLTLIESWKKASLCKLFSCTYYRMLWLFCQVKILCMCVGVVCGWSLFECASEIEWERKFVCERKREYVCVCVRERHKEREVPWTNCSILVSLQDSVTWN